MNLKIKKWDDITINDYLKIKEISEDESLSIAEKDIKTIALLCRVSENEIWNLSIPKVTKLRHQAQFLQEFSFPKDIKFKKIFVGKYECAINVKLESMTISQYVDFQEYFKDIDSFMPHLMSVFLIPKGFKYNEGYDINDLIEDIGNNLSIIDYNTILFFFLKKYQDSTSNTLNSLAWNLKIQSMFMRKKNPLKMKYKELGKKIHQLKELIGSISLKR